MSMGNVERVTGPELARALEQARQQRLAAFVVNLQSPGTGCPEVPRLLLQDYVATDAPGELPADLDA